MGRVPVDISYDVGYQSLIDATTLETTTTVPVIFVENELLFRVSLYFYGAAYNVNCINIWRLGIGDLQNPMIESDNSEFNVPGDWADVDVDTGKISIRVNSNNSEIEDDLGIKEWKQYYCEIIGYDNDSRRITIALFKITVKNTVYGD
jgi:hypothetical protein